MPMSDVPKRILIVQPNWVGDAVMATPALRAIRELYPDAHISYLLRRYVKPMYAGMPWADKLITYRTGKTRAKAGKGPSILPRGCDPANSIWRSCSPTPSKAP